VSAPGSEAQLLVDTFVAGRPKTKGSMRVRNRATGAMQESVEGSSTWRALMAGAIREDYQRRWSGWPANLAGARLPTPGPVAVTATFHLPVDPLQVRAGDLDKLLRNLLDALAADARNPRYNGGVIFNDNQVSAFHDVQKIGPVDRTGVHVIVWSLA
jgi:hypothetical protein